MIIKTGTPAETGHYVCYVDECPTCVRFWLIGTGWLSNLKEPVGGDVKGWIGPLPYLQDMEYDL